jgi:ABC-type multidrug transport system ATPase subunit
MAAMNDQSTNLQWDEEAAVARPEACDIQTHAVTLSWNNLVVSAKDVKGGVKQILKGVTGYIEPRHMLAIMGPSGCGKSTLLDTLSGRLAHTASWTGDIRVNGHTTKLSYGKAAYVTQDEVLIGSLSVRETILYAAKLRLDATLSEKAKVDIVEAVITELGLENAANTAVGNWFIRGISGGQRRRVSIGCELVTSPSLLFLDEPTSGL